MRSILQDLRFAFRQLLKQPGFTATAILSLTCGIAATTAVFSVIWAVLMNPYPYAQSDRVVHLALGALDAHGGYNGFATNAVQWQQIRSQPMVEDAVLTGERNLTITGGDLPEDVHAEMFTSNGWNFFGVPALLGRGILPSDAVGGEDPQPVAVLSYKFWQRRFAADPQIVGKTIQLAREPYTIVGVAPPRFTWGDGDLYLPLKLTAAIDRPGQLELRLKPGVTHRMAEQALQPLITQFAKDVPSYFPPRPGPLHVIGLNEQFVKALGPTLALLFGAVALLLIIGCGNVSILLLARGTSRRHEFAVRAAIGASRARIVRQLLTESLLLSLTGTLLGVLLSYKLVSVIVALLPESAFPHEAAIRINLPVLLFCAAVALLTGILFGLSPALRLSRPDVREAMQSGTRKIAGNAASRATHHALIAGQIALTLLLLTTAGAAIKAFLKLANTRLGYNPRNVMSVGLPIREKVYSNIVSRSSFIEALRNKVAETPGVRSVAVSSNATPPDNGFKVPVDFLGRPATEIQEVRMNLVSPEYFPLLEVPLNQGRLWSPAENHNAAKLCVINEALARRYFPNGDAIGHFLRSTTMFRAPAQSQLVFAPGADGWIQIVGIVGDKLDAGLRKPIEPEAFLPFTLGEGTWTQFLVRSDRPPTALLHSIGQQVATLDNNQQISGDVRDLQHWIEREPEYAQGQLISWLFGAFAGLALLLAAVGLYSVVSYTVAQRTNEFGIRMALGALRADVMQLVARSAAFSVGLGAGVGVVLSLGLLRVLNHVVEGANSADTPALLFSLVVLALVALLASGIPARRATLIEPMEALRYD